MKKYVKAYDSKTKSWVTVEEIARADRYDKPRYYSDCNYDSDSGEILTYVKESKELYGKTSGKAYVRCAHFRKYCSNSAKERAQINKYVATQEEHINKIAKSIGKKIKQIKIPDIKTSVLGEEFDLFNSGYVDVTYVTTIKEGESSSEIPTLVFATKYLGVVETIYVRLFYNNEMSEDRHKWLLDKGINCLEVDISELRADIKQSYKTLSNKILKEIVYNSYWISNAYKKSFEAERDMTILDINNKNILKKSDYGKGKENRCYFFKDKYNELAGSDCLSVGKRHSVDIYECKDCKKCICIKDIDSDDINNVHVYCFKGDIPETKLNIIKTINEIKQTALRYLEQKY